MKKKVSKRGGYRPGAGAKKTGRNTTCISFSVHKDFAEPLKEMVYAKIKELKAARTINPEAPLMQEIRKADVKIQKVIAKEPPKKRTINNNSVSDYLKSRRSKKLGLK